MNDNGETDKGRPFQSVGLVVRLLGEWDMYCFQALQHDRQTDYKFKLICALTSEDKPGYT